MIYLFVTLIRPIISLKACAQWGMCHIQKHRRGRENNQSKFHICYLSAITLMASAFSESLMAFKILGTTKGMTMNFSSDILVSTGRHKTKRKIWHNSSSLKITDQNQEKTIFSNTTSRDWWFYCCPKRNCPNCSNEFLFGGFIKMLVTFSKEDTLSSMTLSLW